MEIAHRYASCDRFVTGSVGESERRVFFVQTRQGSRMTNVVCERAQVRVLAQHLAGVLGELERAGGISSESGLARPRPHDTGPLDVPLDEDFRAGTMTITWLPETCCLRVELYAIGVYRELRQPGVSPGEREILQVEISLDQARDFIARTEQLLGSQAPSCPFCGQPIQPDGHLCPRCNGYRKPLLDLLD